MARILLFNPPGPQGKNFIREGRCTQESGAWATVWPPVSLTTVAAMLAADGQEVRVIDFPALAWDKRHLKAILSQDRPAVVIWSAASPAWASDLDLAELVKAQLPGAYTGIMGTHATVHPDDALSQAALDVVIRREPERIIQNFCRQVLNYGNNDWQTIRGISFRNPSDGRIFHNEAEPFLPPAAIPPPAWHCLDLRPYRLPLNGRPFLLVAPLRGCPFQCSFCTAPLYYGHTLRRRPLEKVLEEMETGISRYGIREFFIWADTFTADRDYVEQFCRAILERKLRISWTCNSRVDRVDAQLLRLMKEAGLWMISFGIESGNNEILQRSGKQITVDQSRAAVLMAKRAGIRSAGHFLLGLPGEREETLQETLQLALTLPLDIAQFYAATPFPGTKLYEEARERGWLAAATGTSLSQDCAVMNLPGLPAERVNAYRRQAYRKFYGRPATVMTLLAMMEWEGAKTALRKTRYFFRWAAS